MPYFALAAQRAGAVGIRANYLRDIFGNQRKSFLAYDRHHQKGLSPEAPFITATMREVDELVATGVRSDCVGLYASQAP